MIKSHNLLSLISVDYLIDKCDLGYLMIAATPTGVCEIRLANNRQCLENSLPNSFCNSKCGNHNLNKWAHMILKHLSGEIRDLQIPTHTLGTVFQQIVWSQLTKIPYGDTLSYSEIAKEIGNARAVRAVANACGRNPTPIIIPCHRVIRKNGDIGGYGLGISRKQSLLERERRIVTNNSTRNKYTNY